MIIVQPVQLAPLWMPTACERMIRCQDRRIVTLCQVNNSAAFGRGSQGAIGLVCCACWRLRTSLFSAASMDTPEGVDIEKSSMIIYHHLDVFASGWYYISIGI